MILALLTAWTLTAQSPDSVVRSHVLDAVMAMSDSLAALRGAGAQFNRDLATASAELVTARAREVRGRCQAATAAAGRIDSLYQRHASLIARDRGMPDFRRALASLQRELARCDREWQVGPRAATVDSVRAWGPHRMSRLDEAARRYGHAASRLPYPKPKPGGSPSTRVGMRSAVDSHFHILWKGAQSAAGVAV